MIPMGRLGEPEELGPLAVYLAGDAVRLHDRRHARHRRRLHALVAGGVGRPGVGLRPDAKMGRVSRPAGVWSRAPGSAASSTRWCGSARSGTSSAATRSPRPHVTQPLSPRFFGLGAVVFVAGSTGGFSSTRWPKQGIGGYGLASFLAGCWRRLLQVLTPSSAATISPPPRAVVIAASSSSCPRASSLAGGRW